MKRVGVEDSESQPYIFCPVTLLHMYYTVLANYKAAEISKQRSIETLALYVDSIELPGI